MTTQQISWRPLEGTPEIVVVNEIVGESMAAIDELVKELIDPIAHVGNPEKLIGKKYEQWTPTDIQILGTVYGAEGKNPLTTLIINKEWAKVKILEKAAKEA